MKLSQLTRFSGSDENDYTQKEVWQHLQAHYHALFTHHPDGIYELDLNGLIVHCNLALARMTGFMESELINSSFTKFIHPQGIMKAESAFDAALAGRHEYYQTLGLSAAGRLLTLEITYVPITIEGRLIGIYSICHDITQQKEQETRLAHQNSHDMLTGLPNLGSLQVQLEQTFQRCEQQHEKMALLYIDLDDFKPVNDALGHRIGDQLLKSVAQRLQENISLGAGVTRLSSDEFVVLIAPYQSEEEIIALSNRLLIAISQPFTMQNHCLHISASIGIASNRGKVTQSHDLIHHASLAMQDAKRQGCNTWHWYCGDAVENVAEHVIIRRELQEAIHAEQFEAYYQPIVDAADSTVRSVETLIRWQHPTKGMVPPGVFMPIAEQTGQIIAIGKWVLERACHDIAQLNATRNHPLAVAVNISPTQFRRSGFMNEVKSALHRSGLPPALLELEVTEGTLMTNTAQAISLLNEVRELGISVALDDFGTGFSSLSYLRDLPINKVKLDRLFIREIAQNTKNAAIVQGVITMAHHLNLTVVAEGIETKEERQDLRQRQCDLLQGFLFSKPVPFEILKRLPMTLTPP